MVWRRISGSLRIASGIQLRRVSFRRHLGQRRGMVEGIASSSRWAPMAGRGIAAAGAGGLPVGEEAGRYDALSESVAAVRCCA